MTIDIAVFAVLALSSILLSLFVFTFKRILHAVVAISALFIANSFLFLLLGQPLLAVVQLFIMVGGISTFLFVGVASSHYSNFKYTRIIALGGIAAAVFVALAAPLVGVSFLAPQANTFGTAGISQSLASSIGVFYVILLVLFGVSLGSVLLLKKIGGVK